MDTSCNDPLYLKICSEKTLQTNSKGFFMEFVDIVSSSAGATWIKNVFGKLKTDKDRIRAIYKFEEIRKPVETILSNVQEIYRKKSAQISQSKRLEAEQAFRKGELKKSLALYSQSVIRAPESGIDKAYDSGSSLALALWGRSEVLMSLQEFSLALSDIQYALKVSLPNIYKEDAYVKMGICYKALNEDKKANVAFNIAEKMIGNCKKLEDLTKYRTAVIVSKKDKLNKVSPDIFTSRKIDIKYETGLGRHGVANENIQTGETLVVEKPFAASLLPEMFGTHCHHCFERLISPVGCPECANVAFCKIECRDSSVASYHRFECKYIDLLIGSGMSILSHTALRMITQNQLADCLSIYKNRMNEKVYSLCTNSDKRSVEDFFQRTLMAAFLLRCLQKCGYFGNTSKDDVSPSEEEYCIGELLLFHLQMLQFNAHEIYETRPNQKDMKKLQIKYIGVGIYPTVSLFNHDCHPAVTRHFVGKNIVIKASRPLQNNDLIAENYGPIFTRRPFKDRQRSLSSRYWFKCQCNACVFNWPTYEDGLNSYSKRLKCTTKDCSYFFSLPLLKDPIKCPTCKQEVVLSSQIRLLKWCEDQYEIAFTELSQNRPQNAIDIVCKAIDTFYRISCPPHRETHLAQETLQVSMASLGNVFDVST